MSVAACGAGRDRARRGIGDRSAGTSRPAATTTGPGRMGDRAGGMSSIPVAGLSVPVASPLARRKFDISLDRRRRVGDHAVVTSNGVAPRLRTNPES